MSFVSSVSGECVLKCDPLTVTERNPQTKWLFISFWRFGHTRLLGQIIMLKSWIFKTVLPRCELWPLLPSVAETTQPTYGKSPTFVIQTEKNSGICWPFKTKMYKKKLSSFHIHFSKCETVFSSQAEILLFMYTALFSAPYITAWMSFKQLWIDLLYESFWMRSWCFECRPLWRCKSLVSVHISVKIKWSAWNYL